MTGRANGNITYQGAARTYTVKGAQTNLQYELPDRGNIAPVPGGFRYHEDKADRYATRSTYAMTNGRMIPTTAGVRGNNETRFVTQKQ